MTDLLDHIAGFADRLAVATETETLTYADLADRMTEVAAVLGGGRRLVMIETRNHPATLVAYLGALAAGHVVLPVPAGRDHSALTAAYRPDAVVDADGIVEHRSSRPAHRLHPDLALLASTSGSTGSPKTVRLSAQNLRSNAAAIVESLGIVDTDRAATTLPLSYCYGASVVHSHLLAGAALILTDRSVIDDRFWTLFNDRGATTFAGVPYTFEMLERAGFADRDLPTLRYVTQAGGRLDPEVVRRYARLGRRRGFGFVVMYGATEATARMAYLPPEQVHDRPESIGRAIPGGSFSLAPAPEWTEPDVGELVYRGPNVMMGYAGSAADLGTGRTVEEFRTGDIARHLGDGTYQVIGRLSRFVKLYGLRIDLQRLESVLAQPGSPVMCAESDGRLVVAAAGGDDGQLQRRTAAAAGLPAHAVRAVPVPELPVLPSGKPDYGRLSRLGREQVDTPHRGVAELFADVLRIDPAAVTPDRSFVDLGGTSLSYVTASVRLERMLGTLPPHWPSRSVAELEALSAPPGRRRGVTMDTGVALRALAIVLIVGSHAGAYELWGGAHLLLAVAGYNTAQFCLGRTGAPERRRRILRTAAWIAVPAIVWIAAMMAVSDDYAPTNLVLLQKLLGPDDSMTAGRMWFVEVLVWILLALAALCWVPAADRLERRWPFGVALGLLTLGVALRYDAPGWELGSDAWFTLMAFWFFAAGWAGARATQVWQRALVTAVSVVALHGYFGNGHREALVGAGLLLLIWWPTVRCPAAVAVAGGIIAEASLYTYLTHFQVYPLFTHPLAGVAASLAVGSAIAWGVSAARRRLVGAMPPRRPVRAAPRPRAHAHPAA